MLNEARDIVRYITSLQKFWDPIYRPDPDEIISSLPGLMVAIRNVSKSAHYFNNSINLTSLFVKIANQLTITCKNFLTENGELDLWNIKPEQIIARIEKSKEVVESFKKIYVKTVEDMALNGERPWIVSSVYIFTCLDKFLDRVNKVSILLIFFQIKFNPHP